MWLILLFEKSKFSLKWCLLHTNCFIEFKHITKRLNSRFQAENLDFISCFGMCVKLYKTICMQ